MAVPYSYTVVDRSEAVIWIADNSGWGGNFRSITNAAEEVVEEVYRLFGDRRIMYRDTEGRWDELVHEGSRFIGFKPGGPLPPQAIERST